VPGGKPVIEVPGERPTLPVITDDPVLVIVEPATTAYVVAAPKLSAVAATAVPPPKAKSVMKLSAPTPSAPNPTRVPETLLGRRWSPRDFQKLRRIAEEFFAVGIIRITHVALGTELSSASKMLKTGVLWLIIHIGDVFYDHYHLRAT